MYVTNSYQIINIHIQHSCINLLILCYKNHCLKLIFISSYFTIHFLQLQCIKIPNWYKLIYVSFIIKFSRKKNIIILELKILVCQPH